MFQKSSNTQTLELYGVQQGRRLLIAITGATSNCELQFQHAGDTNWSKDPRFVGTHTAGVIVEDLLPVSTRLRLSFVSPPGGTYYVSAMRETSGD